MTKVQATNTKDGNGDTVQAIYFKGQNRHAAFLLDKAYMSSQDKYEIVSDDGLMNGSNGAVAETQDDNQDGDWKGGGPESVIGTAVRKYFPSHGWSNGTVVSVMVNSS